MKHKKLGALLLALCMVLTILPTNALAADGTTGPDGEHKVISEALVIQSEMDYENMGEKTVAEVKDVGFTGESTVNMYDYFTLPKLSFYKSNGNLMADTDKFYSGGEYTVRASIQSYDTYYGDFYYVLSGFNRVYFDRYVDGVVNRTEMTTEASMDANGNPIIVAELTFRVGKPKEIGVDILVTKVGTVDDMVGMTVSELWSNTYSELLEVTDGTVGGIDDGVPIMDMVYSSPLTLYDSKGNAMADTDILQDNQTYTIKGYLQSRNLYLGEYYYVLSESTTVYRNALVGHYYSGLIPMNTSVTKDSKGDPVINYEYTFALGIDTKLSEVKIVCEDWPFAEIGKTIQLPSKPIQSETTGCKTAYEVANSAPGTVEPFGTFWRGTIANPDGIMSAPFGTFESGKSYSYCYSIYAEDGYVFADDLKVTGLSGIMTSNNQVDKVEVSDDRKSAKLWFEYNLPNVDNDIHSIDRDIEMDIYGTLPAEGTHPFEIRLMDTLFLGSPELSGAPGEALIIEVIDMNNGSYRWMEKNGESTNTLTLDDAFEAGETYFLEITLRVETNSPYGELYFKGNEVRGFFYPVGPEGIGAEVPITPESVRYNGKTELIVTYAFTIPGGTPEQEKINIQEGLTEVTGELNDTEFNTVEKIEQELTEVVVSNEGYTAENTVIYDIELVASEDGGQTWAPVSAENFPEEGVVVTLPYPEGTNAADYEFTVAHMFDEDVNGHKAGEVETPEVTETANGISFRVMGTSPVIIGYKKAAPAHTHAYGEWTDCKDGVNHQHTCSCGDIQKEAHVWDNGKVTKEPTKDAEGVKTYTCKTCGATKTTSIDKLTAGTTPDKQDGSSNTTSPQTGDSTNVALWMILLIVSATGFGCMYFLGRKRKYNM